VARISAVENWNRAEFALHSSPRGRDIRGAGEFVFDELGLSEIVILNFVRL
jgi:hypothetical protein